MVLSSAFWGCLRPYVIRQNRLLLIKNAQQRNLASRSSTDNNVEFDEKMLEILVCPLTKKPLRYNKDTNELISDTIKVAFPIVNGIPNLVPQDGRMMEGVENKET